MNDIIHIVQHLKPGGIESLVLSMTDYLSRNYATHIISLEGTAEEAMVHWPKLYHYHDRITFLNKKEGWDLCALKKMLAVFQKRAPLAIHTHHVGPLIYAGFAARLAGIARHIHTEHDAWHLQSKKRRILQKTALTAAKPVIVADAVTVAKNIKRFIPSAEPLTILNGIDTEKFCMGDPNAARKSVELEPGPKWIGAAGRLEKVKGHDVLVQAMSKIGQDVRLAIAGQGSEQQRLVELVDSLGLHERVTFLGHVDDMKTFYQALDVFCLPSRNEGMPLAPLEAQACGIPVVATDVGGTREAVCKGSGLLVKPENPDQLSRALENVLNRSAASDCRDFVLQNASFETMINEYISLYELNVLEMAV